MLAALLLSMALAAGAEPPAPEHPTAAGQATEAPAHEAAAVEHDAAASGHEPAAGGHEAAAGEHESVSPAEVLMHHVLDGPAFGFWSKHLAFFVIAAVVVLVLTQLAIRSYR